MSFRSERSKGALIKLPACVSNKLFTNQGKILLCELTLYGKLMPVNFICRHTEMVLICAFGTAPEQAADGYTLETVLTGTDDELLAKYAEQDVRLVRGPVISVMQGQYQFAVFKPSVRVVPEFTNRGKLMVLRK